MTIDSFINIPLIIAVCLTGVLLILLIVVRCRNTAKASFIFYMALGVIFAGLLYMLRSPRSIYMVCAIVLAELLMLPYFIILAFDTPKKREKRARAKDMPTVEAKELLSKENDAFAANKEFTLKASDLFSSTNSLTEFLEYFSNQLIKKTDADGVVILLADEFDNFLSVRSMQGHFPPPYKLPESLPRKPIHIENNFRNMQFQFSNNIFGEVAASGEPLLIANAASDKRIVQNGTDPTLAVGSYIFIPIKTHETIGIAALSRDASKERFAPPQFEIAKTLTDAAAVAMRPLMSFLDYNEHRSLTEEGDVASKFRQKIIPAKFPKIEGISIGCWTNASENVCADFYDVIASRKDRVSFILGDVAGKGMNSFTIMVMIRAMLRLIVNTAQSAATILGWANRGICIESSMVDHFASVVLINYNPETHAAQIATCGINPVLLYSSATGAVTQISQQGEPLGVESNAAYTDIHLKLQAGDILASCTDGLLESLSESGVQYSLKRLEQIIVAKHGLAANELAEQVREDIQKYCGHAQQYDDQSLIVIKIQR
ncbi:MAG: SpoIIE family protein phosphatase [Treponema sp.]|nr:SpoIIE family protein phosphatase [Treponema sp.]